MIKKLVLTNKRLAKDFGEEGLYRIRYDPVAAQNVANMIDIVPIR